MSKPVEIGKVLKAVEKAIDPKKAYEMAKRFDWMVTFLICRFGFVHQIMLMLNKIEDERVGTAGVRVLDTGSFELRYSPSFFYDLTQAASVYVFAHETLHLALHHCTTRKFDDHHMGNVAQDLAVNELIDEIPGACERPRDKDGKIIGWHVSELIKDKNFKDIKAKQSAEWYYDYLKKKEKEGKIKRIPNPDGQSGSGPGSGDGDPTDLPGSPMDDHGDWKENEIGDERVRAKVKEIGDTKSWGSMSDGSKELILAAQTRKINWRNRIRLFFGNMTWRDKEQTRKRPNRRTLFVHPGSKRLCVDRHLVAIDTSGSVGSDLLGEFTGVLNGMIDFMPIDIMMFDSEAQTKPVPYDRHRASIEFKGRGGTNFQPVMDMVADMKYKSVLILTDGCAPAPSQPRNNARVLWVLPVGCNPPVDWGDRVHLAPHS